MVLKVFQVSVYTPLDTMPCLWAIMVYFPEDGQCANVIRYLRMFGHLTDSDVDNMINTICMN